MIHAFRKQVMPDWFVRKLLLPFMCVWLENLPGTFWIRMLIKI